MVAPERRRSRQSLLADTAVSEFRRVSERYGVMDIEVIRYERRTDQFRFKFRPPNSLQLVGGVAPIAATGVIEAIDRIMEEPNPPDGVVLERDLASRPSIRKAKRRWPNVRTTETIGLQDMFRLFE